jgi:hypothetical protein
MPLLEFEGQNGDDNTQHRGPVEIANRLNGKFLGRQSNVRAMRKPIWGLGLSTSLGQRVATRR